MEYVYNVSIVCGLIKIYIFSQEIFHKERIPAGSHEEKNALDAGFTNAMKKLDEMPLNAVHTFFKLNILEEISSLH